MSELNKIDRMDIWNEIVRAFTELDAQTEGTSKLEDQAHLAIEVFERAALMQKEQGWLPKLRTDWENAPRDRSPVLLKCKPAAQISWRLNWPRYIVGRHSGLPEGSDIDFNGWGMPGVGGWIDSDFEGFLPLPTPPQGEDG